MQLIFPIVWVVWFLSEVLLNRLFRSQNPGAKDADKQSLRLIWIAITVAISAGVYLSFIVSAPISSGSWLGYAGLLVIVAGIVIRFVSIRTLGKYFTVDLSIYDEHRLVMEGLYKYIRHPSYSGSLLSFFGLGLSLNNWISLVVICIPVFLAFLYRIRTEERLLLRQVGLGYAEYMKRTKRLIPKIY
jgi:protein-S-isoprenylcysteine O-methyltransferase Ste14